MDSSMLNVRVVTEHDCRLLWEWANEPSVRASAFHSEPISWEAHVAWFRGKQADPHCVMYLLTTQESRPIGQVRFDRQPDGATVVDLGVAQDQRGQGYGAAGLRLACTRLFDTTSVARVIGKVKASNAASLRAFETAGFQPCGRAMLDGTEVVTMSLDRVARLHLGQREIGDTAPCFIIAEAGSNHNGRLEQAKRLIDLAADAGADAVKFQVFRASKLYPQRAGHSDYLKDARSIYDIVSELEMPYEWLPELARWSAERGVLFLASAFDEESVDRLEPFVPAFKIASYEMTHLPLVRYIAEKGKPVIMATGTAHLDEVQEAVEVVRASGHTALMLMQCTAAYPAPLASLNVRAIVTMKRAFGVPVGLSDHSRDPLVGPLAAVSVGANLLEKHFTVSNDLPGPDHRFSVQPDELRLMIRKVREIEQALGTGEKAMHPAEAELRAFARRSIFAVKAIPAGTVMTHENVAILRCGKLPGGFPPKAFPDLLGRTVARPIPAGTAIQPDDVT